MKGGGRIEQAWNRLNGVMPMSPNYLATKFSDLWKSPDAAKADAGEWRKKGRFTNIFSIGNSTLFKHEYRPGNSKQRRWSWCISDTAAPEATRTSLEALVGEVEMRPTTAPELRNTRQARTSRRKRPATAPRTKSEVLHPKPEARST